MSRARPPPSPSSRSSAICCATPTATCALGARPPKGALLVGPPGTGKTLLARATAGEAHAAFFSVSGAEFVESLVGVGAARIRDLFAKARSAAPAIVFIDELDAVGRKRGAGVGQGNDEREQTLNQLLVEMDGFDAGGGLIVLAATNRPDILDPALLRPGRFDRQVTVDSPDAEGRAQILSLYLRGRPLEADVDAAEIARRCPGFTGAELENVVNEAALLSAREGQTAIGVYDLDEAIQRVVGGPRNDTHVLGPDELETIAVHEAAHAVVAAAHHDGAQVHQLSIVSRGRRLGRATALLLDRDRTVLRRSDLERQLEIAMAGAAAERIAFGEVSTAVNDDLHTATQLARSMVTSFGMSSLGPVTIGEQSAEVFLGASLQELGSVGPGTLERIDAETRVIVEAAEERAALTLNANWAVVQGIARDLIAHETLDDALARGASRRRPRRAAQRRARGAVRRWPALGAVAIVTRRRGPRLRAGRRRSRRARALVHPAGGSRRGAHARPVRDRDDAGRPARVGARPRGRRDGRPVARPGRRLVVRAPGGRPARRRRGAAARRRDDRRWPWRGPAGRAHEAVHPRAGRRVHGRARPRRRAGARRAARRAATRTLLAVIGGEAPATLVAPTTADGVGRAVLRLDADGWHREPVDAPEPVHPVGLAAAGPGRAWMLATAADRVVLLRRDPTARSWVLTGFDDELLERGREGRGLRARSRPAHGHVRRALDRSSGHAARGDRARRSHRAPEGDRGARRHGADGHARGADGHAHGHDRHAERDPDARRATACRRRPLVRRGAALRPPAGLHVRPRRPRLPLGRHGRHAGREVRHA